MEKIEYNKKMIGQTVWVVGARKSWMGVVHDVVNADTLVVKNIVKNTFSDVSIYDIRQGDIENV